MAGATPGRDAATLALPGHVWCSVPESRTAQHTSQMTHVPQPLEFSLCQSVPCRGVTSTLGIGK